MTAAINGSKVDNGHSSRPVDRQGRNDRRESPARRDWIDRDDRRDPRDRPVGDEPQEACAVRRPWRFVLVVEPTPLPVSAPVPESDSASSASGSVLPSVRSEAPSSPASGSVVPSVPEAEAANGPASRAVLPPVSGVGPGARSVGRAMPRSPYEVTLRAALLLGQGVMALREPYEPTLKLRFDRAAPTRLAAILAAVRDTERCGLRVLRVDNDDWVTAADIAQRVGWSRETVRLWAAGKVGPGGFPQPANPRRDTTFYSWAEVLPWLRERRGLDLPDEEPALVAANLAVQLRALLPRLSHPDLLLTLLRPIPEP